MRCRDDMRVPVCFAAAILWLSMMPLGAGTVEEREDALSAGAVIVPGNSNIRIFLDRNDARYRCGEEAVFTVVVGENGGMNPVHGIVNWKIDNYGAKVIACGTADISQSNSFNVKGTMTVPGFLRITVTPQGGGKSTAFSAAYEPERICTAVPKPVDFDSFWDEAVANIEKEVPLDPQVDPVPGYPKNGVMVERVSFATAGGKRVYGVLSRPTKSGRYPVWLGFPGAGPGAMLLQRYADASHLSLTMNSHYYRVPADAKERDALYATEEGEWRRVHGPSRARAYPVGGFTLSRERTHYYGIILGCNRAINWLMEAHKDIIDTSRVVYCGTSQGGGFGLILTALNRNITRTFAGVPAMTDVLGCRLEGRQSGWPRILEYETQKDPTRLARIESSALYYDAAYFAERIKTPIRLTVGYIDESCAPHAVLAAFNAIPSKDKVLYHGIGGSHASPNCPRGEIDIWLDE